MANFSVFVAILSAAFLVALALPAPQDDGETPAPEDADTTAAPAGGDTTAAPGGQFSCEAYQQQCSSNGNNVPINGQQLNQTGLTPPPNVPTDQVPQNATSMCNNPQMIQMCGQGNNFNNLNNLNNATTIINQNITQIQPPPQMEQFGNMTNFPAPPMPGK